MLDENDLELNDVEEAPDAAGFKFKLAGTQIDPVNTKPSLHLVQTPAT